MGEEDILLELLAEKSSDHMAWDQPVKFAGKCLLGCEGRRLSTTKNMVTALFWVEYHREGPEHVAALLKRSGGDLDKLPEIQGQFVVPGISHEAIGGDRIVP